MEIKKTEIEGLVIIEPKVFGDNRGWFTETYSKKLLDEATGGAVFVQDNHSMSAKKGTLRGLHYQCAPMAQAKLVRCTNGAIIDVAVDVRRSSPTFMKWVAVELTAANFRQLFLPKGFLHGFVTLCDNCEVQYKVDEYYSPECDRSVRFDSPAFNIDWGVSEPIISDKDKAAPVFDPDKHAFN